MKYRAEIDGLRSLAILPVVAFHSGLPGFSGGFTGVDVFFVISGFLITGIILAELEAGRFSIAEFYKRRVLRILPALAATLLATIVAAFALMLPNEFLATGRSLAATALFLSNVYFWRAAGYFDAAAEMKPLLHTWSLAVEEQFYIFFPLLLMAAARWFGRRHVAVIGLVSLASFLLCLPLTKAAPSAAFYLLPARIWELGLGALIAAGAAPRLAPGFRAGAPWLGVALIGYGVFGLSAADPFPGWRALFPCLGAGLVLAYGAGTPVGALLGRAAPVHVGRISYSLYLWHWPVIVFWRLAQGQEPTPGGVAAMILISFLAAELSWRFVETPFRSGAVRALPASRVLAGGIAGLAGLLFLGGLVARTGGAWRDYPEAALRVAAYTAYPGTPDHAYQFGDGCSISGYTEEGAAFDAARCLTLDPARKNYLIVGDSHAGALWRAIALAWPEINFPRAMASGCRPLLDGEGEAACRALIDEIYRGFLPRIAAAHPGGPPLDGILLIGRWRESDFPAVGPTLDWLGQFAPDVVLLGPTAEYHGAFPLLLASERMTGAQGITEKALDPTKKPLSDALGRLIAGPDGHGARYVAVYDAICPPAGTPMAAGLEPGVPCLEVAPDGAPLQFDYGHLTLSGSRAVVARMRDELGLGE